MIPERIVFVSRGITVFILLEKAYVVPVVRSTWHSLPLIIDAMADLFIRIENESCLKEIPVERYLQYEHLPIK